MNRLLSVILVVVSFAVAGTAQAGEAAGISWTDPSGWKLGEERPMRIATYVLPAAKGDTEAGELGVFYFGQGQGGGVDANVKRWVTQFRRPDGTSAEKDAKTKQEKIAGFPVTTVEVKGSYHGGPMMVGPSTPKPGYRLLGAIVEAPEGAVFFKLTGPEKTVANAEKSFRKLLESMKKKFVP